jgi:DNA-binding Xre family transcriptional regulator
MIRYRIDELLKERNWTRYRLAQELGITMPAVYRLATPGRRVTRIDARNLEKLCEVFGVGIGAGLELVPSRRPGRKRRR